MLPSPLDPQITAVHPAVDDNVVARCNKRQQISTNVNKASNRSLAGKHLKTEHLHYFTREVWGDRPQAF